jgi:hypothetical protein
MRSTVSASSLFFIFNPVSPLCLSLSSDLFFLCSPAVGTNSQGEVVKLLLEQGRLIEEMSRQMEMLRQEVENLRESAVFDPTAKKKPRTGGA